MTSATFSLTLLLAIQIVQTHTQPQQNCPSGQVFLRHSCKPCPAGTFRVANSTNQCIPCRRGTFSSVTGAGSRRLCLTCGINTFADSEGSTRCKPCPNGTVADRAASRCRACGPGLFLRGDTCQPCIESEFNDDNAALSCQSCPSFFTSPEGSTSVSQCRPCPPGQFASFGACAPCIEGTFNPGRRGGLCQRCPPGSVSAPGSSSCRKCPAGTFSGRSFQQRCNPCPKGTTSNGPSATRCRPIGSTKCPTALFENINGDCERCRPDFRYNRKRKICVPCPAGSVSKGGLETKCTKCPPGQTASDLPGVGCVCPKGKFKRGNKCRPCPKGTGGNFDNVPGKDGCIECDVGTFADQVGTVKCKPCPFGTFADEQGSSSCKNCPPGSVSNIFTISMADFPGSTRCLQIKTGCPLGAQPARDVFNRLVCRAVDCVVGTKQEDIGVTCRPCKPGSRLVGDKCKKCPIDSVSDGGVITSCTKCRNGLFRSFFDDSKCACDGEPGAGKGIQNGVCKDCPPGTASDGNISVCKECRPGSFASGFGNQFCKRCPKGTFSDNKGSAACRVCPTGQVPERVFGSRECVPVA